MNQEDSDMAEAIDESATVEENTSDYVINEANQTLYALSAVNLRVGPSSDDYAKIGSLSKGQEVHVIGEVTEYKGKETLWFVIEQVDGTQAFVAGSYLSEYKPPVEQTTASSTTTTSTSSSSNTTTENPTGTSNSKVNDFFSNSGNAFDGVTFGGQATVGDGSGNFSNINLQ